MRVPEHQQLGAPIAGRRTTARWLRCRNWTVRIRPQSVHRYAPPQDGRIRPSSWTRFVRPRASSTRENAKGPDAASGIGAFAQRACGVPGGYRRYSELKNGFEAKRRHATSQGIDAQRLIRAPDAIVTDQRYTPRDKRNPRYALTSNPGTTEAGTRRLSGAKLLGRLWHQGGYPSPPIALRLRSHEARGRIEDRVPDTRLRGAGRAPRPVTSARKPGHAPRTCCRFPPRSAARAAARRRRRQPGGRGSQCVVRESYRHLRDDRAASAPWRSAPAPQ